MIAVIDSGMGGLTTLAALIHAHADHRFAYYADVAHAPYGALSRYAILEAVRHAADEVCRQGADGIVLGCNTATLAALHYLQGALSVPVWGVAPPVDEAVTHGGKTLLVGTEYTCRRYRGRAHLAVCALPQLATMVDEGADAARIEAYCRPILAGYAPTDNLVLGCTHYLLVREVLGRITRATHITDGHARLIEALGRAPSAGGVGVDILSNGAVDAARYLHTLGRLLEI